MKLTISPTLLTQLLAHLQSHLPEEACGMVGGAGGRALKVYPVENELHSRVAYQMAAKAQIEAMLDIEERGWEILAIFHSHPGGPPVPSMTDVRQAYYPESIYLIAAPDVEGSMTLGAYEIVDGKVREADLEVTDDIVEPASK